MAREKRKDPSPSNLDGFAKAVEDLNSAYEREQMQYVEDCAARIKAASDAKCASQSWRICNEVTGRKKSNRAILKRRILLQSGLASGRITLRNSLLQHLPLKLLVLTLIPLRSLLKQSSLLILKSVPQRDVKQQVLRAGWYTSRSLEVRWVAARAPGDCNSVLNGDKPDIWSHSGIIPIPKKGDLSNPQSYRGIALTPIAAKIYNRLLLNCIRPKIDPLLRGTQNGYRKGRSTQSHVLTLRRVIEGIRSKNLPAVLTFVDFRKAMNTRAKVLSVDGETEKFEITAGVLQGDTLAPFLFIIIVDYVMRETITDHEYLGLTLNKTTAHKKYNPENLLTDTGYADDLSLLSNTFKDAQEFLTGLEEAASKVGLLMNEKKTEVMAFNTQGSLISRSGQMIKQVDDFKYLGSYLSNSAKDINVRIGCAWAAIRKLDKSVAV